METAIADLKKDGKDTMQGRTAFEMYDTFGFPVDLTQLILKENGLDLDYPGFEEEMKSQKARSREDAAVTTEDWNIVRDIEGTEFTGYTRLEEDVLITRYRTVKIKGKENFQIVLNKTPFYAESGGQVGDTGTLTSAGDTIPVTDTIKENNLIIHQATKLPSDPSLAFRASVNAEKRLMTANNHTATHLIHNALRTVLGNHVEQKGSLVTPDRLRFDFSHFAKVTREELTRIEQLVNRMVREDHPGMVTDGISIDKARAMGALALFGEKYGEKVRVVEFGNSVELCGGTHVASTGTIGIVKIVSEGAIAAGVRRIEAVTAARAEEYINEKLNQIGEIALLLKSTGSISDSVGKLISENAALKKSVEKYQAQAAAAMVRELEEKAVTISNVRFISGVLQAESAEVLKNIAFHVRNSSDNTVLVIGSSDGDKANLLVMVSDRLVKENNLSAVSIIREISGEISGGGGGQPFLATAGGKNPAGIPAAISRAALLIRSSFSQSET